MPTDPSPPAPADGGLVVIARRPDLFAAELLAVRLRDADIEAFVFQAERGWTGGVGFAETRGGVPVWVREDDIERAQAVLDEPVPDPTDEANEAADPINDDLGGDGETFEPSPRPLVVTAGMVFAAAVIVLGLITAVIVVLKG